MKYAIVKTISFDMYCEFETDEFQNANDLKSAIWENGEYQFDFNWIQSETEYESAFDVYPLDETRFEITDAGMEIVRGLES